MVTEADVEAAALDWLRALGWQITHGPSIVPDTMRDVLLSRLVNREVVMP